MSLVPTIFSSTDPGAPQLSGINGSLTALLDAILVDGYGTGPAAKPSIGWTREYSATNKRVYKNNVVTGTGRYLRVLDDGSSVGGARMAKILAFSSMSDIDTGTDQTPSAAVQPAACLWVKSQSADSTMRPWWAIGNERAFYLFVGWYNAFISHPFFAGDLLSDKVGDRHHFMVSGGPQMASFTGSYTVSVASLFAICKIGNNLSSNVREGGGSFLLRSASGLSSSVPAQSVHLFFNSGSNATTYGHVSSSVEMPDYPDPVTNSYRYCDCLVGEGLNVIRGRLPGVVGLLHKRPFTDLAVLSPDSSMPYGAVPVVKNYQTLDFTAGGVGGNCIFLTGVEWT